jgi:3-carboxy-cis,cis-muconate cycloisomerase
MMDHAVEQSLILTADLLVGLDEVLSGLQVLEDRMRRNLTLSGGLIMAESVMMALAKSLGRQRAHELVHHAAQVAATTDTSFASALAQDPAVTSRLTPDQIDALLDPARHTGDSAKVARDTAAHARATVADCASSRRRN